MTSPKGKPPQNVANIQVGALVGPSEVVILRIQPAPRSDTPSDTAHPTPGAQSFMLTHEQARSLAMQLQNSLRWIDDKPAEPLH
ncbi:hypothetical protein BBB39_13645 [Bordetella trematum]|uniref:Uncharacterized protein n=1 Tax=Bordetella trematum TaxID=123899 RepID=A0A157Q5T7_9BORD|nr:hypothetical protein [Bordetella trematum]AZR94704.1 hypothetical protein BBB39_13645 [Bordetella trematum]NNH19464.1 hypothetical protein [Bordetella trematum]QIM73204.1 hypothetical protein EYB34_18570 [Bordetella trematum]SAH98526.1 Uncharacterised protein [Bordetella trematum]SAI40950.1 Uncharacterised protein [Bordetella trematum]